MGRRVNFADLAGTPVLDAPIPTLDGPADSPTTVPIDQVAANPLNPRDSLGDLTDLAESLRSVGQLQPCAAVRRNAYLAQYPEHETVIGTADYIAVTGGRRRAAALMAGLPTLDISVKDGLATSRETLAAAAIAENIERQDFDVIEEARAVQALADLCGSAKEAAAQLSRTEGWVSQRRTLLKLSEEMRDLLRSGEIPVRDARRLALKPVDEQLSAWRAEQAARDAERFTAVKTEPEPPPPGEAPARIPRQSQDPHRVTAAAIRRLGTTPIEIAASLRSSLASDDLAALITALRADNA